MFLRNSWYVFGWVSDLANANPIGRIIIGEPVVVWRDREGGLHAMEDRCPHRHAPLSRGRIEGQTIRCMYHGMSLGVDGRCLSMPLMRVPPNTGVQVYPITEKDSWLWIWMGKPEAADASLIPDAFGVDDPQRPMRWNSIEYDAHYQLVHDNLCDLSHLDFVHETTLRPATGAWWAQSAPRIVQEKRALSIQRWFENAEMPGTPGTRVDIWSSYEFAVPGVFIMRGARYLAGTAARFQGNAPEGVEPIVRNIEQQAVTPISSTRTAYHYATGLVGNTPEMTAQLAQRMDVVMATFEEDRSIIEAQQRIWALTSPDKQKQFLPQDRAPHLMRQLMTKLIEDEASEQTRAREMESST